MFSPCTEYGGKFGEAAGTDRGMLCLCQGDIGGCAAVGLPTLKEALVINVPHEDLETEDF